MHYQFHELTETDSFDPASVFPDAPFTQAPFYGTWQQKLNRSVRRFIVKKGGGIVAYFQLIAYPLFFGKTYLYIPYGPLTLDNSKEFLATLKSELTRIANIESAAFVRLDFTPTIPSTALEAIFFKSPASSYHSAYFQPRTEWLLDLSASEEALLSNMHEKTRYSIRLAERKGVSAEIITDNFSHYFDPFYTLMQETARRNGFSLHPRDYYRAVFDSLSSIPNAYLSVTRFNQSILAIDLIIVYAGTAHYIFGASSSNERNRMPAHLAQWHAITKAKSLGAKHYSFGAISDENDNFKSWDGLTAFKKKFGGSPLHHCPFFDVVVSQFWYYSYIIRKGLKRRNH